MRVSRSGQQAALTVGDQGTSEGQSLGTSQTLGVGRQTYIGGVSEFVVLPAGLAVQNGEFNMYL